MQAINSPLGTTLFVVQHDARGNQTLKGGQGYQYDLANRLIEVTGKEAYRYDGLGRRVWAWSPPNATMLWQYSQDGRQLYASDGRRAQNRLNVYLGNTVVATRTTDWGTGTQAVRYLHTDGLGSPVAETTASGTVAKRNSHEPYGAAYGATAIDGIGYTGHVMDQGTGLTYMQQRYYDPQIGRFLSVDPVATSPSNGSNFNRYWYAADNPYRFKDPDGRYWCSGAPTDCAKVDKYVATITKSLTGLKPGSDAFKKVTAVVNTLGKPWTKNGITLNPTTLAKGTLASAGPNGTVNIDMKQTASYGNDVAKANPSVASADAKDAAGAGVVAHETRHEIDAQKLGGFPTTKAQEYRTEMNAYGTEAGVAQGLGVNVGLSTPQDIAAGAQSSTDTWCASGGQCP